MVQHLNPDALAGGIEKVLDILWPNGVWLTPAPLLSAIVMPSTDAAITADTSDALEERYSERQAWWTRLLEREDAKLHRHLNPGVHAWLGTSAGKRGLSFIYTVRKNDCGVIFYIDRGKGAESINDSILDYFEQNRDAIEDVYQGTLTWESLEAKRACWIKDTIPGGYRSDEKDWEAIQKELTGMMDRLVIALTPYIEQLHIDNVASEPELNENEAYKL